jgi:hypothetical protein
MVLAQPFFGVNQTIRRVKLKLVFKIIYWIIIIACLIIPVSIVLSISFVALLGMFVFYWLILIKQFFVGFYTVPKDWFSIAFLELFKPILVFFKKEQK